MQNYVRSTLRNEKIFMIYSIFNEKIFKTVAFLTLNFKTHRDQFLTQFCVIQFPSEGVKHLRKKPYPVKSYLVVLNHPKLNSTCKSIDQFKLH